MLLSALVEEYSQVFAGSASDENAILLYAITNDLHQRLDYNQKHATDDERIDRDLADVLTTLIASSGIYLQGFDSIREMSEDSDRAARTYLLTTESAKSIPWELLNILSTTPRIFTPQTEIVIGKVAGAHRPASEANTNGILGLGIGTLRGSLRAMGGNLLDWLLKEAAKTAKEAAKEGVRDAVRVGLQNAGLQQEVISFLRDCGEQALQLSASLPAYFSWLEPLIQLLRSSLLP